MPCLVCLLQKRNCFEDENEDRRDPRLPPFPAADPTRSDRSGQGVEDQGREGDPKPRERGEVEPFPNLERGDGEATYSRQEVSLQGRKPQ